MIEYKEVKMGKLMPTYNNANYQDVTFCVTEECNLRCTYCYMTHKNSFHVMTLDVAKQAVDFVLSQPITHPAVVWDFIGGEPTIEMDLIDEITDYIKYRMFELDHPWQANHVFFLGTNGILYRGNKVQNYLRKNAGNVQVAITIDGNKTKHDLSRVYPDGTGSYDEVLKSVQLWCKQTDTATGTKATFSSPDLPFLCDSIISLWEIGLEYIAANVVFENVWKQGDAALFESELRKLADYVIENKLWDKVSVRFFDPTIGTPLSSEDLKKNFCGTGSMIAIGTDGKLYPCIRFLDFCMDSAAGSYCVGSIYDGFNRERQKPFKQLTIGTVSSDTCKQCNVGNGCFSCAGNNYNDSGRVTIFNRSVYNCDMHKAQIRAMEYFWTQYSRATGLISPYQHYQRLQYLRNDWDLAGARYCYIICEDNAPSICMYCGTGTNSLNYNSLNIALDACIDSHYIPIFVTNQPDKLPDKAKFFLHVVVCPAEMNYSPKSELDIVIPIYKLSSLPTDASLSSFSDQCGLLIDAVPDHDKIQFALSNLKSMFRIVTLIPLCQDDVPHLAQIAQNWDSTITIRHALLQKECSAGANSIAICPDGNLYACPAFYFDAAKETLAFPVDSLDRYAEFFHSKFECDKSPLCLNCKYANYKTTGDIHGK